MTNPAWYQNYDRKPTDMHIVWVNITKFYHSYICLGNHGWFEIKLIWHNHVYFFLWHIRNLSTINVNKINKNITSRFLYNFNLADSAVSTICVKSDLFTGTSGLLVSWEMYCLKNIVTYIVN